MIMKVKQISIFMENKPGKLGKISEILHNNNVFIEAMMIEDAGEFGIIKLIVNNPEKGKTFLVDRGFTVSESDVIVLKNEDSTSYNIFNMAKKLEESNINIHYSYGFSSKDSLIVLKTNNDDKAIDVLKKL